MAAGNRPEGLKLTEEEAFALLGLCLTSPTGLDAVSEKALRKLAEYCSDSNCYPWKPTSYHLTRELGKAGA
jgi:hypothetical protein